MNVPVSSSRRHSSAYSASEPSHQCTASGCRIVTQPSTHSISLRFVVGGVAVVTLIAPVPVLGDPKDGGTPAYSRDPQASETSSGVPLYDAAALSPRRHL